MAFHCVGVLLVWLIDVATSGGAAAAAAAAKSAAEAAGKKGGFQKKLVPLLGLANFERWGAAGTLEVLLLTPWREELLYRSALQSTELALGQLSPQYELNLAVTVLSRVHFTSIGTWR